LDSRQDETALAPGALNRSRRSVRKTFVVAAAALCSTAAANAQRPAPRPAQSTSTATGAIIDSLYGGRLRGALVAVDGASRAATTDSAGRFTIDSIPVGSYRLVVMHPLLDTLGIGMVTPTIDFAAGDTAVLILGTPSVPTVVRLKCGAGPFPGGPSVVLGLLTDTDTGQPVRDATVVLAWSEVQASRETGVRRLSSQRVAKTEPNGTFRICGVPGSLAGEMFAWRGPDTTGVIPVVLEGAPLALRALVLPSKADEVVADTAIRAPADRLSSGQRATVRRGRAVVRGTVMTVTGTAVTGARVSVHGAAGAALTNDRGEFVLVGQPSGTQTVAVRRLGYEPAEFALELSPAQPREVTVELSEFVPVLETVVVEANRDAALARVGFSDRQRAGLGRYLTLEDIERRGALRLVDLLANVPPLQSVNTGGSDRTLVGRMGGCVQYFVDGMPWLGDDSPSDFMSPAEVGAIEVYSEATTPAEFQRGMRSCSTVVIWTRLKLRVW
jgi:hypothetical protein